MSGLLLQGAPERNTGFGGAISTGLQLMLNELSARDRILAQRDANLSNIFANSAAVTREFQRQVVQGRRDATQFARQRQLNQEEMDFRAEQGRLDRASRESIAGMTAGRPRSSDINAALINEFLRSQGRLAPSTSPSTDPERDIQQASPTIEGARNAGGAESVGAGTGIDPVVAEPSLPRAHAGKAVDEVNGIVLNESPDQTQANPDDHDAALFPSENRGTGHAPATPAKPRQLPPVELGASMSGMTRNQLSVMKSRSEAEAARLAGQLTQSTGIQGEPANFEIRKQIGRFKAQAIAAQAAIELMDSGKEGEIAARVFADASKPMEFPELSEKATTSDAIKHAVLAEQALARIDNELSKTDDPAAKEALLTNRTKAQEEQFKARMIAQLRKQEGETDEKTSIAFSPSLRTPAGIGARTNTPKQRPVATGELSELNKDISTLFEAKRDAMQMGALLRKNKSISGLVGKGRAFGGGLLQQFGARVDEEFVKDRNEAGILALRLVSTYKPIFDRLTDTDVRISRAELPDPKNPFKSFLQNEALNQKILEQSLGSLATAKLRREGYDISEFEPQDIVSAWESGVIEADEARASLKGIHGVRSEDDVETRLDARTLSAQQAIDMIQLLGSGI